jgi:hypothetical protein
MTRKNSPSKTRIEIAPSDSDEYLVMIVSTEAKSDFHQISLAHARALSLELIKQVYRAEMRSRLSKAQPTQSIPLEHKHRQHA